MKKDRKTAAAKCRKAADADKPKIISILKASFNKIYAYYAAKSFKSLRNTLVTTDKTGVTGVINWRNFRIGKTDVCYLYWLAVRPDRRRQGLGTALFRGAIRNMRKGKKCAMICGATEKSNAKERRMLAKEGFSIISRKALKEKFGKGTSRIIRLMNLMPWEDLYVKAEK